MTHELWYDSCRPGLSLYWWRWWRRWLLVSLFILGREYIGCHLTLPCLPLLRVRHLSPYLEGDTSQFRPYSLPLSSVKTSPFDLHFRLSYILNWPPIPVSRKILPCYFVTTFSSFQYQVLDYSLTQSLSNFHFPISPRRVFTNIPYQSNEGVSGRKWDC